MAVADPEVVELVRQGWEAESRPLGRRRMATELAIGGAFLVAAIVLAGVADADRHFDVVKALVFVALFALAIRVNIDVGAGYTSPVQAVFVPMLLLLPTPAVPLLVAAGWFMGRLPDLRDRAVHPDRLLLVLANSWFALGPALVLVLLDAQTPSWGDWPIYLLALLVQFLVDFGASSLREWVGQGIAPEVQMRVIALVTTIDALLAPLGLLAAFASDAFAYAFLLLVPAIALLVFYGRERTGRLEGALALADAAQERQELIASASHELVTPLGVLIGLTDRIAPGRRLDDERHEQVHAAMERELVQLRQLVRQFVDYTRLKTDRALVLGAGPATVATVMDELAATLAVSARVRVRVQDDLAVRADPDRLHQMVLALASALLRDAPAETELEITATAGEGTAEISVSAPVPGPIPGFEESGAAGIGLHVTCELALAQGGNVRAEASGYVLTLPLAG